MLEAEEIKKILPHRYPFLLVDRVLELEKEKRVVGIKNISINEPFFVGHFPGRPIMPGVLIVEALAQVGGILYIVSVGGEGEKLIYFMGIDKFKFRRQVLPGDQLRLELTVLRRHSRGWKMKGCAYVDGNLVAEGNLLALIEFKGVDYVASE
jgi:3-hydroxyacyl-[acyl-carrier-protein] dehydratase